MAGLERIVVGHRKGSRRVHELEDQFGIRCVEVRNCMAGCGYPVYFASGGVAAVVDRDAEVICQECRDRYYGDLLREL